MKKQRADGYKTRQKLLAAASDIFARKGLQNTINRDICLKSGANTALINYHSGSKENLYIEAWKYTFHKSLEKCPIDGRGTADAADEEKLRGEILSLMQRIADPENHDPGFFHKEINSPTGLLEKPLEEAMTLFEEILMAILKSFLGHETHEHQIRLCHMSILEHCFGPMLTLRRHKIGPKSPVPKEYDWDNPDIKKPADHVTAFSIAGLRGIRDMEGNHSKCL